MRQAGFLPAAVPRWSARNGWALLGALMVLLAGVLGAIGSPRAARPGNSGPGVDEARRQLARLESLRQRSDELGRLLDRLEGAAGPRVVSAATVTSTHAAAGRGHRPGPTQTRPRGDAARAQSIGAANLTVGKRNRGCP